MEGFITVNEASLKYEVSKKTIYSYLEGNNKRLWIKKINNVIYINSEKLENYLKEKNKPEETIKENIKTEYDNLNNEYIKLQDKYNLVLNEKENLEKLNNNLTSQINNTTLALKEEKNNKETLIKDNQELKEKINSLNNEILNTKISWIKKLYTALIFLFIAITIIWFLIYSLLQK